MTITINSVNNLTTRAITILTNYLLEQNLKWSRDFAKDPDMLFKLNVHLPAVYHIAQDLAPHDPVLQLAALYHDYGRVFQYNQTASFNDGEFGSTNDHHYVGYQEFLKTAPQILQNAGFTDSDLTEVDNLLEIVAAAIKLHGLRGKAFAEDFTKLTPTSDFIVSTISQIDDIANGTQCAGYLLRECQEQAKNASRGGFIPDENATDRLVTPEVMNLLRASTTFDRNKACKTYPDYCVFATFLITRSLNSPDPQVRKITLRMLAEPITVIERVSSSRLFSTPFDDIPSALSYIYRQVMIRPDADKVNSILKDFIKRAEAKS